MRLRAISLNRVAFVVLCFVAGAVSSYYAQPYVHDNSDALLVITTVFSVFAGFMIAIISVLGDPSLIPGGSWMVVETRRENIERQIVSHIALFFLYLITIALVFVAVIIKKTPDDTVIPSVKIWIDRSYMFFGVSAFLLSFSLPAILHRMQMGRIDAENEKRRTLAGIKRAPDNGEHK